MSQATTDRVFDAIAAFLSVHGYSPSLRDIGRVAGIFSPAVVSRHLAKLRARGLIAYNDGVARSIRVIQEKPAVTVSDVYAYETGLAEGRRESAEVLRAFWMAYGACPCGAWRGFFSRTEPARPHADRCLVALALEKEGRP